MSDWVKVRVFGLKVLLKYEHEQARPFGSLAGLRIVDHMDRISFVFRPYAV